MQDKTPAQEQQKNQQIQILLCRTWFKKAVKQHMKSNDEICGRENSIGTSTCCSCFSL